MSESINNREYRKNVIKQVIAQLHEGKSVEEVKQQFDETFSGVSATEISEVEGALIAEGLPVTEIQRLCDVHAAVFKGSIEEIHQPTDQTQIPGHPANTLIRENAKINKIINEQIKVYLDHLSEKKNLEALKEGFEQLSQVELHYLKKENLIFPYLEKYGITAPPKVMWGVDDEIRELLKEVKNELYGPIHNELNSPTHNEMNSPTHNEMNSPTHIELNISLQDELQWKKKAENLLERMIEMIFKEENILIPMLLETLTQDEWKLIADESDEIGFMIDKVPEWKPIKEYKEALQEEIEEEKAKSGLITLSSGVFTPQELGCMLNTLPFDITFVDKNDVVKYFSEGAERIFPRTKAIIGRNVSNCHPPASVHVVEQIVEDLKAGRKDHEDFWINMKDKFVYIRYYAVRDIQGQYLGVLEISQDIKPIQEITGEKRLVSEE